jgi:hypothetical protein
MRHGGNLPDVRSRGKPFRNAFFYWSIYFITSPNSYRIWTSCQLVTYINPANGTHRADTSSNYGTNRSPDFSSGSRFFPRPCGLRCSFRIGWRFASSFAPSGMHYPCNRLRTSMCSGSYLSFCFYSTGQLQGRRGSVYLLPQDVQPSLRDQR